MFDRYSPNGLEVVYIGPYETEESCRQWKQEYGLEFPVVPDKDGTLFKKLSNGWVPCNILVGRDGRIIFAEGEFDEKGYTTAIAALYEQPEPARPEPAPAERPSRIPTDAACIVILGGGVGGIVAAHDLRRRLPKQHRVVVIDRSPDHQFQSSLLWLMVGLRKGEQIHRPLGRLADKGVEFHQGEVEEIDVGNRFVRTASERFDYDHLIISLGAQLAPEIIDGFDEMAYDLYDLEGCTRIRTALDEFSGGTVGVLISQMPFKCPAAPYEAAFLVESHLRKRGVRDKTEIHIFTPEHQPMPIAGAKMGEQIAKMLGKRGIHYHPLYTFEKLRPETNEIVSSDGTSHKIDLVIAVPPHQAPKVVRSAGLIGVSGWIHVDPNTLRTEHEGAYAIGDVTTIRLPNGKALPKAGVFAHNEAKVVAEQIAAEVRGRQSRASFDGKGYCWLELGDGKAGFAGGRFYAEPEPKVRLYPPGRVWHWGKVAFEKWWLRHWF